MCVGLARRASGTRAQAVGDQSVAHDGMRERLRHGEGLLRCGYSTKVQQKQRLAGLQTRVRSFDRTMVCSQQLTRPVVRARADASRCWSALCLSPQLPKVHHTSAAPARLSPPHSARDSDSHIDVHEHDAGIVVDAPRRLAVALCALALTTALASAVPPAANAATRPRPVADALIRADVQARDDFQRREREFETELQKARLEGERSARESAAAGGLLCATPYGVDVVGITEAVAFVGALVGGVSARQRKVELEEVNDKLRKINLSLRQQARAGTTYAPGLNYAPPSATQQAVGSEAVVVSAGTVSVAEPSRSGSSSAERSATVSPPQVLDAETEIRQCLRDGRSKLKESAMQGSSASGMATAANTSAMVLFKKALLLSKQQRSAILERRARRGLAVARRQHGDRKGAVADLLAVLEISERIGEHTGDTDALGAIADLYTEQGELEKAGQYYDRYIAALSAETSGSVD